MIKTVRDYITEYEMIKPGDEIVIGLSGGADSVCLFLNLIEYSREVDFTIKAVHINHLIREEAGGDADFVRDLCAREKVKFFLFEEPVEKIAKEEGISTEEAGRMIRYKRFEEVLEGSNGKIAVAHNSNDVAETVLFNMFRGTGLEGLSSLEPVNGKIIRPLLGVGRKEIEDYLEQKGQLYMTDKTNMTDMYARNKIRNTILPYAEKEIVSGATSHIFALSEKMRRVRDYIERETKESFEKVACIYKDGIDISASKFEELDELMKREVLLLSLEKLTPHRKDICERHIEQILDISDKEGEKKISLPYNLEAVKQYEHIYIRKCSKSQDSSFEIQIGEEGLYDINGNAKVKVRIFPYDKSYMIEQNTYTKWFDYDKIRNCLMVRTRRAGDYITINKELDRKSLKDYLMDEKVPKEERNKIALIADGSHIVWVVGHRISWDYKVTENTKTICEITYID